MDPKKDPTGTEYYTGKPKKNKPSDEFSPWFYETENEMTPDELPDAQKQTASRGVRWFR
jgi:hypothetical protein